MADGNRLHIARTVLLVLLVCSSAALLGNALRQGEAQRSFAGVSSRPGSDPGIRVLITNRVEVMGDGRAPPQGSRTWSTIQVTALTTMDVWTPDDAANPDRRAVLAKGATLTVAIDVNGMTLECPRWTQAQDRRLSWNVTRVLIQPRPAGVADAPPLDGVVRDPALAASEAPAFQLGRNRYRGALEVQITNFREAFAINHLPVESYLAGVVGVEMSPGYPLEALKAQAVASRGFAMARRTASRQAQLPYDLVDGQEDQEYRGAGAAAGAVLRACHETRGLIMLRSGAPFLPMFSACSGGATSSAEWVLPGSKDLQGRTPLGRIMVASLDPWAKAGAEALGYEDSHWATTARISGKEMRMRLAPWVQEHQGRQLGHISNLRVAQRDPVTRRVLAVAVHHTAGDPVAVPAATFRLLVAPERIRSTLWSEDSPRKVDSDDRRSKDYLIGCFGWGHGVGMSQVSAWQMAASGATSDRILRQFYQQIDLARLW